MNTAPRRTHENSLAAYWAGKEELFSKRELAVLGAFRSLFRARGTDRQVMVKLGFVDPNKVRPRITGLIECGLLAEVGRETDPATGKTVRVVALLFKPVQTELPLEERRAS